MRIVSAALRKPTAIAGTRSEEHTSELQSQSNLVCRLLLEKKNNIHQDSRHLKVGVVLCTNLLSDAILLQTKTHDRVPMDLPGTLNGIVQTCTCTHPRMSST